MMDRKLNGKFTRSICNSILFAAMWQHHSVHSVMHSREISWYHILTICTFLYGSVAANSIGQIGKICTPASKYNFVENLTQ